MNSHAPDWAWLGLLLSIAVAGSAAANLRAPLRVPQAPSTALLRAEGLVVQHENLRLDCGAEQCDITAVYEVQAPEAMRVSLSFILPAKGAVDVQVRGQGGHKSPPVQVVGAALTPSEAEALSPAVADGLSLGRVRWTAELSEGANTLQVRYVQRLSVLESGHGYFSDGVMLDQFEYHLWPLLEWQLSEDFMLDLIVTVEREPPSLWQRLWGSARGVGCLVSSALPPPHIEQQGGQLIYTRQLTAAELPPVLTCNLGPVSDIPSR